MNFFERIYRKWWHTEIVRGEEPTYRYLDPSELVTDLEREAIEAEGKLSSRMAATVRAEVERQGGNKRKAARVLGISPTTLYRYLEGKEEE